MRTDLKNLRDSPPWEWPKSAGRTLLRVVSDSRASNEDRLLAIMLAGDFTVINEEICEGLLKVLNNSNEQGFLRGAAALSFGAVLDQADTFGFEDPDDVPIGEATFRLIQTSLEKIYRDPDAELPLRRSVLETSVRAPEDWHNEAIASAYASGKKEWVRTAVFCMQYVQGFESQILESLNNPDEDTHQLAVTAATNMNLKAARDHVVELVEDPDTPKELLLAAIAAVGLLAPDEAATILEPWEDSEDEEIAEAVDEAISSAAMLQEEAEEDDDADEDDEASEWVQ
jgi:hypothetical protein